MRQFLIFALLYVLAYALLAVAQASDATLVEHMHDHLSSIDEIRDAIIEGELEDVRGSASWLAIHEPPSNLPANWQPFVDQMKAHATDIAAADSMNKAAMGVADMARVCGECHLQNKLNLEFAEPQKPDDYADDVITHMQRHQWAVDRMWLGMILPSDIAWNRGTDMLIDVALHPSEVTPSDAQDKELRELARKVHQLGSNGIVAVTPEARSELYSDMISTCAECHRLIRVTPR